jgi:hypothetical protein
MCNSLMRVPSLLIVTFFFETQGFKDFLINVMKKKNIKIENIVKTKFLII